MWRSAKVSPLLFLFVTIFLLGLVLPGTADVLAQQPTGSVPTVTGTPPGPYIQVYSNYPIIRVYAGPSSLGEYPAIGVLQGNETAPALARAKGKLDWIQIYYPGVPDSVGWVWANNVKLLSDVELKVIDVPATPTPQSTPTINPTLVAAFIGQQTPTRLPTYTPPPPLDVPQFTDTTTITRTSAVPVGLLIFSFALLGFFGVLISYLRGR